MIPGLDPISADSLAFLVISLALILIAWSGKRSLFSLTFALASGIVVLSWLSLLELLALMLFLVPPYFVIRALWGSKQGPTFRMAAIVILWETVLFIYLRKYDWGGNIEWLDHPIAIIGLSYILFRIIHLIVEAPYFGTLPFDPVRYVTYTLAYWTLLSGPIQRYEGFTEGMKTVSQPSNDEVLAATHRATNGLLKAFAIAPIFLQSADLAGLQANDVSWIDFAIVFYSYPIYLYLNFSGYTDLVIAVANLCGVKTLPENFNRPYLARNILDFWARWHISFGTWIRHYIFTPLSKKLVSAAAPSLHSVMLSISIIVTFVVVGVWHGTTLNFVIFGLLHSAAIIILSIYSHVLKSVFSRQRRKAIEEHPLVHFCSITLCFHFVSATVMLFPNSAEELNITLQLFFANVLG